MDGQERDLGWEDVGQHSGQSHGSGAAAGGAGAGGMPGGQMGAEGPISDAVTKAMVSHFAREFTKGSLSIWPQFVQSARWYFNVTQGYVLRKLLWQLAPLDKTKKKSCDGELGGEKDWTARVSEGLELDIEEPDLYIPAMGFVTYVLLCGLIRGLQDNFHPDVLYATLSFATVALTVETLAVKAALFLAGAVNSPAVDIAALLGYKFFYLSLCIVLGLLLGGGRTPVGLVYHLLQLLLAGGCGAALWQAFRRLTRMQPAHGHAQECAAHQHQLLLKALPVLEAFCCWCLLPSWPAAAAAEVAGASAVVAEAVSTVTTTAKAVVAAAAAAAAAAGDSTAAPALSPLAARHFAGK